MSIQIHKIINQFTQEMQQSENSPEQINTYLHYFMQEIASGFFYLMYIDYERNNFKEYFDETPSVYTEYSLDLLSPEALSDYNKDKHDYPELFI